MRSERNSTTDYIASLDFSFQSKAVRDLLRREGIPFTDEQAPALTVVPIWRGAPGCAPPRDEAAWTNVWKGLDLEHALTPVKLQVLKKEITPAAIDALAGGDGAAIRTLVASYGSEYVLIAVAERDAAAEPAQRHLERPRRRRRLHAQARLPCSMPAIPATPASWRPSSRSASSRAAGRPSSRAAAAPACSRRDRR